jgi:hypothetical protein
VNILREKLRARGHHCAQFGGGSSSSSAQNTTQSDNRVTVGNGGINAKDSTVQVLDGGAISNAFSFANNSYQTAVAGIGEAAKNATNVVSTSNAGALKFADSENARVLDFATKANTQAATTLNATSNLVKDAYADAKGRGALTDKILIGAIAMAGLVAVMALKK